MDLRRRLERLEKAIEEAMNQRNNCDLCRGFATTVLWRASSGERFVEPDPKRITSDLRCAKCGMEADQIIITVAGTTADDFAFKDYVRLPAAA